MLYISLLKDNDSKQSCPIVDVYKHRRASHKNHAASEQLKEQEIDQRKKGTSENRKIEKLIDDLSTGQQSFDRV